MLDRTTILAAKDLKHEDVEIEEWRGSVRVVMLNLADRLEYERWVAKQPEDSDEIAVRLLTLTLVDAEGARLFSEDDVKDLLTKNPAVLLRLGSVAARVNKLGETEVAVAVGESGPRQP